MDYKQLEIFPHVEEDYTEIGSFNRASGRVEVLARVEGACPASMIRAKQIIKAIKLAPELFAALIVAQRYAKNSSDPELEENLAKIEDVICLYTTEENPYRETSLAEYVRAYIDEEIYRHNESDVLNNPDVVANWLSNAVEAYAGGAR